MSEVKHSPGPWEIGTSTRTFEVCTVYGVPPQPTEDGGGQEFVYIYAPRIVDGEWYWADPDAQFANARLIAASPDLLAVAQMVLDTASDTTPPELLAAATAAVAKAEGR